MTLYSRSNDRRRIMEEIRLRGMDIAVAMGKQRSCSPKGHLENEKRVRREIANSNERRRMQSINAGFQSLKSRIPHHNGEKPSKAAILQQACDYISTLEDEKAKLLAENAHLKKMILEISSSSSPKHEVFTESPPPKRRKRDTESSDEGISLGSSIDINEESNEELQREISELRRQLDRERRWRLFYEERLQTVEGQLYPDSIRHIAAHVQASMQIHNEKAVKMCTKEDECVDYSLKEDKDSKSALESSMSRKNLETIVEAIRHLEGDRILFDERKADEKHPVANSEDSEKESSMSDHEDTKSDSSGRDSPVRYTHQLTGISGRSTFSDKYPIASDLLHRPLQPQYYRPGVIVHKS